MGDSYSSGEGDTQGGTWYEPGTDEQGDESTFAGRNLCHMSRRSYPYLLAVELGYLANNSTTPPADGLFHSVACSGAKIHNVLGGKFGEKHDDGSAEEFAKTDNQYRYDDDFFLASLQPGATKQLNFTQTSKLPNGVPRQELKPEVITLGIGGNDVDFGGIIFSCVFPGTCGYAQENSNERYRLGYEIAMLKYRLVKTYELIKQQNPDSKIYVHGYPIFVNANGDSCGLNVRLNQEERTLVVKGVQYLNQVVKAAAEQSGVFYVEVGDIINDINLCSGASSDNIGMNAITAGNDIGSDKVIVDFLGAETYHPNPKTHIRYKERLSSATVNFTAQMPDPIDNLIPIPDIYFGQDLIDEINQINNNPEKFILPASEQNPFIINTTDNSLFIKNQGLLPNSNAEIEIHSDPFNLGQFSVDNDGVLGAELILPDNLEPGAHEVVIKGFDNFGDKIEIRDRFYVGVESNDFDGDGTANDIDSCQTVENSGIDVDNDGVDDVCDNEVVVDDKNDEFEYCTTVIEETILWFDTLKTIRWTHTPEHKPYHPKEINHCIKLLKTLND